MDKDGRQGSRFRPMIAALGLLVVLIVVGLCVAIGIAVHEANNDVSTRKLEMRQHLEDLEKNGGPKTDFLWDDTLADLSDSEYSNVKEKLMEELATQDVNVGLETISSKQRFMHMMAFGKVMPLRHQPGTCRRVPGADGGSEDMTVLSNGMLMITSGWFPNTKGRILMYDFNNPMNNVTNIPMVLGKDSWLNLDTFHPHGMSSWEENGVMYIYALQHPPSEDSIEMFEFDPVGKVLHHIRNFTSPHFTYMNDFVMVAKDKFFITKFWRYRDVARTRLEVRLMSDFGEVMFYDGTKPPAEAAKTLIKGLIMPNGINISPDKRYVYVAEVATFKLRIYKRNEIDNSLIEHEVVDTGTGIDNIEIDPQNGDLWIGCHPIGHLIWEYIARGATGISPSQVVRIRVNDGSVVDMIEVYINNGEQLSATTSATKFGNVMTAGALAEKAILECEIVSMD